MTYQLSCFENKGSTEKVGWKVFECATRTPVIISLRKPPCLKTLQNKHGGLQNDFPCVKRAAFRHGEQKSRLNNWATAYNRYLVR